MDPVQISFFSLVVRYLAGDVSLWCSRLFTDEPATPPPLTGEPATLGLHPNLTTPSWRVPDLIFGVFFRQFILAGDVSPRRSRRFTGQPPTPPSSPILKTCILCVLHKAGFNSARVSTGIEMSGGVSNITVKNVNVWVSHRGMRIKTAPGRGGYVRDISYRNVTLDDIRVGLVIKTDYNEHHDTEFDPSAVPVLENISYVGIHGQSVRVPVRIHGSEEVPVKGISFQDMSVGISYKKKHIPVLFC